MNDTKASKSPAEKQRSKRLLTIVQLVVYPILAIGAIVGTLWYFNVIGGPQVCAVVDCGYWTTPCCIAKGLASSNDARERLDLEQDPAKLLDAESVYHILVRNKRGPMARGAELQIPHAYYIEVIEDGEPNDHWQLPGTEGIWYPLGNIKSKQQVEVNAWTTSAPDRKKAATILISHEDGDVSPYVKTPVIPPAEWLNRYRFWVVPIAGVLSVGIFLLHRYRFCK